jgi:hypothetical protein
MRLFVNNKNFYWFITLYWVIVWVSPVVIAVVVQASGLFRLDASMIFAYYERIALVSLVVPIFVSIMAPQISPRSKVKVFLFGLLLPFLIFVFWYFSEMKFNFGGF